MLLEIRSQSLKSFITGPNQPSFETSPSQDSSYLRHVQVWTLVIRASFVSRLKLTAKMPANVFSGTHMYFWENSQIKSLCI